MKRLSIISCIAVVVGVVIFLLVTKPRMKCLNNLADIENAKSSISLALRLEAGQSPPIEEFLEYFSGKTLPRCPLGGRYEINPIGKHPVCPYHGDLISKLGMPKDKQK
jgi:hypothetical protein